MKNRRAIKTKNRIVFKSMIFGVVLFGLAFFILLFSKGTGAVFNPISIVGNISNSTIKQTDGRTNILLLGSDKRGAGEIKSVLTDTIIIASIGKLDKSVVLLSLPRDLWVESPMGYKDKINSMYAYGGSKETKKVAEKVLGIPIHYYVVIDFNLFKQTINIIDGIDVTVENTFDDFSYPIEGKENAPDSERYQTVHFEQGAQKMDGDTALKYVRSRHGNNGEDTDFARSKRQQKTILAIKDKALSLKTLANPTKIKELFNAYSENIDTDISLTDLQGLYLFLQDIDFTKIRSVVLDDRSTADNGGLLYAPADTSLYGGSYVLIPRAGDFSQLHAYVQKYIFGE